MAIKNKEAFEQLKKSFVGQRRYYAKNDAYIFDIFDDTWQLGTKEFINLEWMHDQNYDWQTFIDLRLILAKNANQLTRNTVSIRAKAFKSIGNNLSPAAFKLAWLLLSDSNKQKLTSVLSFAVKVVGLTHFQEINEFAIANRPEQSRGNKILDPEKGVYSEVEYHSIKNKMRLATDSQKETCHIPRDILAFGNLIGNQLMLALLRRPCQLAELKWIDVLPVGQSFSSHRQYKGESVPSSEYFFSDVERLHIRTFKGKDGVFRGYAERRSHRLEPDLSVLLLKYRIQYESILIQSLEKQGISLTSEERRLIMLRCPLFAEEQLFTMQFENTHKLFKSLGFMSDAFHKRSKSLQKALTGFTANLDLKSDRIENNKLKLSSNRLRHTVLTLGARQNLSSSHLASITGVTQATAKHYLDLSFEARMEIDQAFARNEVLSKFGEVPVNELLKQDEYVIRNEFDEEMGIRSNPENCDSCASKLGAPLGCYPCDNFHASEDGDHQSYLDKAISKYEINKTSGDSVSVNKLKKIILYIQITIDICEERKLIKKGLHHA